MNGYKRVFDANADRMLTKSLRRGLTFCCSPNSPMIVKRAQQAHAWCSTSMNQQAHDLNYAYNHSHNHLRGAVSAGVPVVANPNWPGSLRTAQSHAHLRAKRAARRSSCTQATSRDTSQVAIHTPPSHTSGLEEVIITPKSIHDVDNGRLLGFGADLAADHPVSAKLTADTSMLSASLCSLPTSVMVSSTITHRFKSLVFCLV